MRKICVVVAYTVLLELPAYMFRFTVSIRLLLFLTHSLILPAILSLSFRLVCDIPLYPFVYTLLICPSHIFCLVSSELTALAVIPFFLHVRTTQSDTNMWKMVRFQLYYDEEYEDGCFLGCCAVQSGRQWPTFQRWSLPPSSPNDRGSNHFWNVWDVA
jgi:hypothetical protein